MTALLEIANTLGIICVGSIFFALAFWVIDLLEKKQDGKVLTDMYHLKKLEEQVTPPQSDKRVIHCFTPNSEANKTACGLESFTLCCSCWWSDVTCKRCLRSKPKEVRL